MNKHACHSEIITRLKRASGHLTKVIAMIEAEEECEKVAQQLQAVTSAMVAAKRQYVTDHIENCLDIQEGMAMRDVIGQVKSLKAMAKYL
ncbi:MAG: metal-sensing transcriptional repressor [Magnetococcales bacterium]|nr:metal-sensing transcriptional repressor [Magnetococcales bacterium]MBF0439680.1 metal-sensing transcriptional repressor [Magnetococcales bacterium]